MRDKELETRKNKEFFNDKINWKFFNFLVDKSTELEDIGYDVWIYVGFKNYKNDLYKIYGRDVMINSDKYGWSDMTNELCIDGYEKYGLFYVCKFYFEDSKQMDLVAQHKFRAKVIDMSRDVSFDMTPLVLVPKIKSSNG